MSQGRNLKQVKADVQEALKRKDWPRGVELLEEWCRQKPGDARGWYYRAYFLAKLGLHDDAEAHVDKALDLDPDFKDARKLRQYLDTEAKSRTQRERAAATRQVVWHTGKVVDGRYEVRGSKRGGMGEVYFAFDRELDHMVAVKAPLASMLDSESMKARFYREAEAWMGLGMHPNICAAHYIQEIGGIPWLFIEYVNGGTLDEWLKRRRATFLNRLDIAVMIASGMNHTHTFTWRDEEGLRHTGLVHRDLKPANILMDDRGVARITDFGLVGLVEEDDEGANPVLFDGANPALFDGASPEVAGKPDFGDVDWEITADVHWQTVTVAGMALGTPPYMAPEQWRSAHQAGFPADVYAYGCILYDIFCGRRPFVLADQFRHAMPAHQVFIWEKMHREEEPPDPRSFQPAMNAELAELMLQCLAKDPADRPDGFEEVRNRLKDLYLRLEGTPYPRPEPRASRLLADSFNNHGVSFMTIGQTRRAEANWREALRADPHHIEATFNMAMYQWTNNAITFEEIYRRMEEVGRTHSDSWRHQQLLGRMYLFFGEYAKGAKHLQQASRSENAGVKVLRDLGLALCAAAGSSQDVRRWSAVERVFRRVIDLGYEDPAVKTGYALAMKRQGRQEDAEKEYQKALAGPNDLPATLVEAVHSFLPGQELIDSVQHRGWVNLLAFGAEGDRIICGSEDKISVWMLNPGECVDGEPSAELCNVRPAREMTQTFLHGGLIHATALSPDGSTVITGSSDGMVRMYGLSSGELLRTFKGHSSDVRSVAFSPDGRYALSGGSDTSVRLWELATGKCFSTLEGHSEQVNAVAFSPDGLFILSASDDRTLRLWDSYAEECVHVLKGHTDRVTTAAFGPRGKYIVSGGHDKVVRVWKAASGRPVRILEGHTGRPAAVLFGARGRSVITAGHDRTVRLWNLETSKLEKTLRFDSRIEALAVSRDFTLAAIAVSDADQPDQKAICLVEFYSRYRYRAPYAVTLPVSAFKADMRDNEFQEKLRTARDHLALQDYFKTREALDEARAVPGYARDTEALALWSELAVRFPHQDLRTAWEVDAFEGHEGTVTRLVIGPRGRRLLSGGADGTLRMWDVDEGRCLKVLDGHTGPVTGLAMFGHGKFAVSCGRDKTIRFWDLDTMVCTRVLMEQTEAFTFMSVGPDGRYALTLAGDENIGLWDLRSQIRLRSLRGHGGPVNAVAFSPDGRLAVSGSKDKTVRLWDLETGECRRVLKGHASAVTDVLISPDGRYVVSASVDRIFRKWEIAKGEMPETFGGHSGPVTAIAASPDAKYMVSGSTDKTLRLWDLTFGKCLGILRGHAARITSLAFSPDRQNVFSACDDGTIRVWHLDWEPDLRDTASWDEEVRPYLDSFLTLHTSYAKGSLERVGKPHWNDLDFDRLMKSLSLAGYGWISPKGVSHELDAMAKTRQTRMPIRQTIIEFFYGIRMLLYPLRYLKKPALIILKLIPAAVTGLLMYQHDFLGLPAAAGILIVLFLILIMFAPKKK